MKLVLISISKEMAKSVRIVINKAHKHSDQILEIGRNNNPLVSSENAKSQLFSAKSPTFGVNHEKETSNKIQSA